MMMMMTMMMMTIIMIIIQLLLRWYHHLHHQSLEVNTRDDSWSQYKLIHHMLQDFQWAVYPKTDHNFLTVKFSNYQKIKGCDWENGFTTRLYDVTHF